ncbi:tyrosine-protein kinase receptor Tie-1-like [Asterias rubens]|uniref:tyrosine-protein kinase receptor Tie-1-like n=1 Tax=Asterias rubens TaxID=7604 RepID=UPI001455CA08|nr:tyrosine-protein kinase receptor Tie-1-like [Asterias rubens]
MPALIGAERFGVYNCIFTRQQDTVRITTTVMRKDGDVSPTSSTLTTSAGEDVTLTMTQHYGSTNELRWRQNGVDVTAWNGQSSISIPNVQASNTGGIYECYVQGRYNLQNHALMKLIVRACSQERWGSSCDNRCPMCHNGGVCDDKTGECICAPGFSGTKCQILHGKNCFGQDCGITCSITNVGCKGVMMCLPDPFGCTCAAGFKGQTCTEECKDGYFGANCELKCHCEDGAVCDKGHGRCPDDVKCASGYTGENCQECPEGLFGATCIKECHCEDGEICDKVTGTCPDGVGCQQRYRGINCQSKYTAV